jgi:hypothetical protein
MFHYQFEAVVKHNWTAQEKATHLLVILQGPVTNAVHSIPAKVMYKNTAEELKGCYGDHLSAAPNWKSRSS